MTTKKTPAAASKRPQKAAKPAAKAKVPAKATKAPTAPAAAKRAKPDEKFTMPREVADWIERANSIMNHQKGQIERLKKENDELKAWRKWAEHRILRSDHE